MSGTSLKGAANSEKRAVAQPGAQDRPPAPGRAAPAPGRAAPAAGAASGRRGKGATAAAGPGRAGAAPPEPRPVRGAVVVDPFPLFRAGAVAALNGGVIPVLGEAAQLSAGIDMARRARASVLLVGGPSVAEATEAVNALPGCAVVVLLGQPSRGELVEMVGTGVAGFALRSLTPDDLVSTVGSVADGPSGAPRRSPPVFMPVLVAAGAPNPAPPPTADELVLTPKEQEILALLSRGASTKAIAEALYVTPATVKTHLAHIYAKLGAKGRHEAVSRALARGLVS
jgi:DNA-binding NarL/FixJ family response regulator